MEDLIFLLPIFILFLFILFRILSLFKRGFDFIRENFDLTIEQADEKIKNKSSKMDNDNNQNMGENRIADAITGSIAEKKEEILNQRINSETKMHDSRQQKKEKIKNKNSNQGKRKNKNSSLGEIFAQYNEVEKAVIYNEILSKPKALKRD